MQEKNGWTVLLGLCFRLTYEQSLLLFGNRLVLGRITLPPSTWPFLCCSVREWKERWLFKGKILLKVNILDGLWLGRKYQKNRDENNSWSLANTRIILKVVGRDTHKKLKHQRLSLFKWIQSLFSTCELLQQWNYIDKWPYSNHQFTYCACQAQLLLKMHKASSVESNHIFGLPNQNSDLARQLPFWTILNDEARNVLEKLELEEDITSFYTSSALKI